MRLYPHQVDALDQTEGLARCAYYLDMGLGKTYVGAEKMVRYGNRVNLLVCQKSKIDDWVSHFADHYELQEDLTVCDCTKWKGSDWNAMSSDTSFEGDWHARTVLVINYELAWRRPELLKLRDFTLMLDESSLIQNPKAKQTKFILKLKPRNVILLSGTPSSGKYENLWSQMKLLGWDITERSYHSQYVNWREIWVPGAVKRRVVDKSDPYRNLDRLKRKLREHGAVFMTTDEVFDLPEQVFTPIMVRKSRDYIRFCKSKYLHMGDGTELVGDTLLTERLCKRRLCGAFSKEKLSTFEDLLRSTNGRVVVFYNFNDELDRLSSVCAKLGRPLSVVNGRGRDLEAYENDDDSVTLVQYQAGAMGLNLQKSSVILYYTPPERSDLFEQSKKRIHRIGQNRTCFYYMLLVRDSIETDEVIPTLRMRKDWNDRLFEDSRANS